MQRQIRVNAREEGRTTCPYCLEALGGELACSCPRCRTGLHPECLAELGHCPTLACGVPARRFEGAGLAIAILAPAGPPSEEQTRGGEAIASSAAARGRPRPPPMLTGARLWALAAGHLLWRVSPEHPAPALCFGLITVPLGLLARIQDPQGLPMLLLMLALGIPALLYAASGPLGMTLMRASRPRQAPNLRDR